MIPMTAIKIIHYLTYHLDTTSQVIHKFSLIHPHELDHFTHPQQTFSSSKCLYSLTGHIFSKTFKCILVILVSLKVYSVLLIPFYHQELEILGWFIFKGKKDSVTE